MGYTTDMQGRHDVGTHMVWFLVFATAAAYGSYLVLGSIVHAHASGIYEPVVIRDELQANKHTLSGMVMVPTACDQLSVETHSLSKTTFALTFRTWREPSVTCE